MSVDIKQHTKRLGNNDYVMVSGRLLLAHAGNSALTVRTELVSETPERVLFRAEVVTDKGVFTGWAASYLATGTPQEKKTPYEVAETSAIGRALGFAGYAIEGGIASAEEMGRVYSEQPQTAVQRTNVERYNEPVRNLRDLQPTHEAGDAELFDLRPTPADSTATEKQIKAIYSIGRAARRMSEAQVDDRCCEVFGIRPVELTKAEASQFIDMLKQEAPVA